MNTEAFDRQGAVYIQRHTGLSEGERQDFDSFGEHPVLIAVDVLQQQWFCVLSEQLDIPTTLEMGIFFVLLLSFENCCRIFGIQTMCCKAAEV